MPSATDSGSLGARLLSFKTTSQNRLTTDYRVCYTVMQESSSPTSSPEPKTRRGALSPSRVCEFINGTLVPFLLKPWAVGSGFSTGWHHIDINSVT